MRMSVARRCGREKERAKARSDDRPDQFPPCHGAKRNIIRDRYCSYDRCGL